MHPSMHTPQEEEFQRSESFLVAALLALAGGMLDAYSYHCRGGVFANAETGNMVLMGMNLVQGNWLAAGRYLIPVGSFTLGILAAELVRHRAWQRHGVLHWRHHVLLLEIALVCLTAFVPLGGIRDAAVNSTIAFVCALQVETFRKVMGNPFASTMCTGNLRSGTEALYYGLTEGDRAMLRKSGCYFAVIGIFISGAAAGTLLCPRFGQYTVLSAAALQLTAWLRMCVRERRG